MIRDMVRFLLCVRTLEFLACEIIFSSKSDCEFTRRASFRAIPRTSQARQYHFPLACPHLFLFIFHAMPSKNHASRKHAIVDTHASKTRANQNQAMRCHFEPVSTTLPNRGKTPQIGIFVETRKSD
jgi:hypothetical protein